MNTHHGLPLSQSPAHRRQIQYETCKLDDDHIEIRGELIDTSFDHDGVSKIQHHMVIRLTIKDDLRITDAEFLTLHAPFGECSNYAVGSQSLVGLSASHGFTKKIYELYGKEKGCSHIVTLLMNLAAAIRQGIAFSLFFPRTDHTFSRDARKTALNKMAMDLTNTCMTWAEGSPVQQSIQSGNMRGLEERLFPNSTKIKR